MKEGQVSTEPGMMVIKCDLKVKAVCVKKRHANKSAEQSMSKQTIEVNI